jgi:hypothetical protein
MLCCHAGIVKRRKSVLAMQFDMEAVGRTAFTLDRLNARRLSISDKSLNV